MKSAPWQLYAVIVAGWMSQRQQEVIDHLHEENRVLREKLGIKRIRLNDDQRRRLAAKGKILGRRRLAEVCSIVTVVGKNDLDEGAMTRRPRCWLKKRAAPGFHKPYPRPNSWFTVHSSG